MIPSTCIRLVVPDPQAASASLPVPSTFHSVKTFYLILLHHYRPVPSVGIKLLLLSNGSTSLLF